MKVKYPHLFAPYRSPRGFTFKNRLLSAPIGVWTFTPADGMMNYALDMFETKAKGGCAAVTMGDTQIAGPSEKEQYIFPLLAPDVPLAYLSEYTAAVHQHGALASLQMACTTDDYGPSPAKTPFGETKALDHEGIEKIIGQFRDCAKVLKATGFDMCMVHFAHGKLFDQWLSPNTNLRTDEYGGSIENRISFPLQVLKAIRDAVGGRFMIEVRITGADPVTETERFETHAALINAAEDMIDLCHVSSRGEGFAGFPNTFPCYLQPLAMNVDLAAEMKKNVRLPIVAVGGINTPQLAEEILESGKADFVAMGRALIADPELPKKTMTGLEEDILPCIGCHNCLMEMHNSHYFGCDINPRTGRESRIPQWYTASVSKKVVIVGGGPAGMQAAITAFDCGHKVILMEKTGELGGILKAFDSNPVKYRMKNYKEYLIRQVKKRDIDVRLGCDATPELVEAEEPDAVFAAVGSSHIIPNIAGVDRPNVMTALRAHEPDAKIGRKVAIIGGNLVGCETGLTMLAQGREPTVIEMTERLHADAGMPVAIVVDQRLSEGVRTITNARCTEITEAGVIAETPDGDRVIEADTVILAVGMQSNRELAESFRFCAPEFRDLGDCAEAGTVRQASRTGFYAARDL